MMLGDRKYPACDYIPTTCTCNMQLNRTYFGLEFILLFNSLALLSSWSAGGRLVSHVSLLSGFLFSMLQTEGQRRKIKDSWTEVWSRYKIQDMSPFYFKSGLSWQKIYTKKRIKLSTVKGVKTDRGEHLRTKLARRLGWPSSKNILFLSDFFKVFVCTHRTTV